MARIHSRCSLCSEFYKILLWSDCSAFGLFALFVDCSGCSSIFKNSEHPEQSKSEHLLFGVRWLTLKYSLIHIIRDALMLKGVLTDRHAVLDFGDHKNK